MKRLLFLVFLITSLSYGQRKIAEKVNGTIIPIGYTELAEDSSPELAGDLTLAGYNFLGSSYFRQATVSNAHLLNEAIFQVEGTEGFMQILASNSGSYAAGLLFTSVESAGVNHNWGLMMGGTSANDNLTIRYNQSSGDHGVSSYTGDEIMTFTKTGDVSMGGSFTANDFTGDGQAITLDASGFSGNLTTSDDTLQELAVVVDGISGGGTDDQVASEVPFTPAGTIAATNVQDAIEEVASEAGTGPSDRVMVSDSTYTLTNANKGKIHEFWADVESIDFTLPGTPDDDAEWTIAQMTNAKVGSTDSLRNGATEAYYRTSGSGKYMTVYSVADTTRLRVLGGIESYTYSTGGSATVAVAASSDDAKETISTGVMDLTADSNISDSDNLFAMRFVNPGIPAGATITEATIQLEGRFTTTSTPATIIIKGQKGSDPATFTTTNSDISNRTQTTASVSWDVPGFSSDENGPDTLSADFSTVVQEIIDDGAYSSAHEIVIIFDGSTTANVRRYKTFDFASGIPEINLTWTN